MRKIHRGGLIAGAVTAFMVFGLGLATAPAAAAGQQSAAGQAVSAAAPAVPVEDAFQAPLCEGTLNDDPTSQDPELSPVEDVTLVWGKRLDAYNDGLVVPLYDSWGGHDLNGYPPVCATRYVEEAGGPVSEWMYCTDIHSKVCSGTSEDGGLVNAHGDEIDFPGELSGNPRLTDDQENIISWLIHNGYPYTGYGDYAWDTTFASNADFESRAALQTLIWCVSDPVTSHDPASEVFREQTCDEAMSDEIQESILALIPADPTFVLDVDADATPVNVGQTATIILATNMYLHPITLDISGVAGTLTVVSPGATYDAATQTLRVDGTDPGVTTEIELAFVASEAGTLTLSASGIPAVHEHIGWNQSTGVVDEEDGVTPCQVFATFHAEKSEAISASASVQFIVAPTTPAETTPVASSPTGEALANTGADQPIGVAVFAAFLALTGAIVIARARLRQR